MPVLETLTTVGAEPMASILREDKRTVCEEGLEAHLDCHKHEPLPGNRYQVCQGYSEKDGKALRLEQ